MFHYSQFTPRASFKPSIDETIGTGLKLIICANNIDHLIDNQECFFGMIIEAIDNVKYINRSFEHVRSIKRSLSSDACHHYGNTYNSRLPLEELVNELSNLKLRLSHSQANNIYNRLTRDLDEIIKQSNIEHDISMAYLFKVMLKETLIKGKRTIVTINNNLSTDNHTNEKIYRYTWRDKFIVICYVLGHIPYINGALIRSRSTDRFKYGRADLIGALQHARRLLSDYAAHDIAIDSINMRYGCI